MQINNIQQNSVYGVMPRAEAEDMGDALVPEDEKEVPRKRDEYVPSGEDEDIGLYAPSRQLLVIGINQKIAIQWDFPITYEMARAYQKANGKYLRQNQWEDITLVMSLELGK